MSFFSKKKNKKMTRLVFATDIPGSERTYCKFSIAAGSQSVRKAIETHPPMLSLHGHIHESQAIIQMGWMTCISPGSDYGEGILRGCPVPFADGKAEGFQMTSG